MKDVIFESVQDDNHVIVVDVDALVLKHKYVGLQTPSGRFAVRYRNGEVVAVNLKYDWSDPGDVKPEDGKFYVFENDEALGLWVLGYNSFEDK